MFFSFMIHRVYISQDNQLGDEYGWKQVHGDVFRTPSHSLVFATILGSGYQLLVVTVAVILFTILGELYTERGSLLSTAIFVYAATSPINGTGASHCLVIIIHYF